MTPLLCVLVSWPGRGWRSRTTTEWPRCAIALADARPVTPAPITATSICSIPARLKPRAPFRVNARLKGSRSSVSQPARPARPARLDPVTDGGVVEMREHEVVEDHRVRVQRVRDLRQRFRAGVCGRED